MFSLLAMVAAPAWATPPPQISVQPSGLSVSDGGTAVFTVTVTVGTTLTFPTFNWRLNGQNVGSGLTVAAVNTLTLNHVHSTNAGNLTVEIRNAGGAVTSAPVSLTVLLGVVNQVVTPVLSGLTSNGFHIVFNGPTGSNVVIQASSDLSSWDSISTNKAANGSVDFTDTTALNRDRRFYRAYVP